MFRVLLFGTGLLMVAGALQLWHGRLSGPTPIRRQLLSEPDGILSPADRAEPGRILDGRAKLANVGVVCCELLVMTMTAFMLIYTVATFSLPSTATAMLAVTYVLGAYLVGRAVYIRLGLSGTPTGLEEQLSVPEIEASLANTFGDAVEDDFAAITSAMNTARGVEEALDPIMVSLLAGARAGESLAALEEWGRETGVVSPEEIDETATRLVESGLLEDPAETGPLAFSDQRLAEVESEQVATITASVLN